MNHNKVLDEEILLDNLGKIAFTLDKAYISKLSSDEYGVVSFEKYKMASEPWYGEVKHVATVHIVEQ